MDQKGRFVLKLFRNLKNIETQKWFWNVDFFSIIQMLACHHPWAEATPNNLHICQIMRFWEILDLRHAFPSSWPSGLNSPKMPPNGIRSKTSWACFISMVWVFWSCSANQFHVGIQFQPSLWIRPTLAFRYLLEMDDHRDKQNIQYLIYTLQGHQRQNWWICGDIISMEFIVPSQM